MRVAGDACDAFEGEVEGFRGEAGAGEERDHQGAEAAVDVEGERSFESEPREGGDVVNDAVREVGGGADEEDGVAIYKTRDGGDVDLVAWGWAVN